MKKDISFTQLNDERDHLAYRIRAYREKELVFLKTVRIRKTILVGLGVNYTLPEIRRLFGISLLNYFIETIDFENPQTEDRPVDLTAPLPARLKELIADQYTGKFSMVSEKGDESFAVFLG